MPGVHDRALRLTGDPDSYIARVREPRGSPHIGSNGLPCYLSRWAHLPEAWARANLDPAPALRLSQP